jgi:hypothetical protein
MTHASATVSQKGNRETKPKPTPPTTKAPGGKPRDAVVPTDDKHKGNK